MGCLYSSGKDGFILQWDIDYRTVLKKFGDGAFPVKSFLLRSRLNINPDLRDSMWVAFNDGKIKVWDLETGDNVLEELHLLEGPEICSAVARQRHVYYSDSAGQVHDVDMSVIGVMSKTTTVKLGEEGMLVNGLVHKGEYLYAGGEVQLGSGVRVRG